MTQTKSAAGTMKRERLLITTASSRSDSEIGTPGRLAVQECFGSVDPGLLEYRHADRREYELVLLEIVSG
jgi:hypothetical protein